MHDCHQTVHNYYVYSETIEKIDTIKCTHDGTNYQHIKGNEMADKKVTGKRLVQLKISFIKTGIKQS